MHILNDKSLDSKEPLFIGREQELQHLFNIFKAGGNKACIWGRRGSGKTALGYVFGNKAESSGLFPGGWHRISAAQLPFDTLKETVSEQVQEELSLRALLLLDDFDIVPSGLHDWLDYYLDKHKNLNIIVCTTELKRTHFLRSLPVIKLQGLSRVEFFTLLRRHFNFNLIDEKQADKLFALVAGDPLYADLAGKTIREQLITFNEFVNGLSDFRYFGIKGTDGNVVTVVPRSIEIDVGNTNAILLDKLRSDPTLLRDISSRKFEEIIAELLDMQGYDVDLTPPSQDGGFDIYAARKDGLGQFLFLVECKRYTPPNKVGVAIVRSLHGVVQQKQANAGIIVTSSFFTRGAQEFQQSIPYQMKLQDYIALQQWLGILK